MTTQSDDKRNLELIIDRNSISGTLEMLAEVCFEKAEHIQASYATTSAPDPLAKQWRIIAERISGLASRLS